MAINTEGLFGDSATSAGYIGQSFYQDPLPKGAIDTFTVRRAALSPEQVTGTVANVPALQQLSQAGFDAHTTPGTAPRLPHGLPLLLLRRLRPRHADRRGRRTSGRLHPAGHMHRVRYCGRVGGQPTYECRQNRSQL
ncbi:hypothetical protein [Streptomyces sp. NPDC096013]|uniref:hypothetical protein n=1 Tax=Streptomyces sp. NPDC096013 TaxID=3366069 RepID=UPI00382FAD73